MSVSSEEGTAAVSSEAKAIARKSFAKILQQLQEVGSQQKAAKVLGVSESTVSRMKTEQAEHFCLLLASLGLRVEFDHFISANPRTLEMAADTFARIANHPDRTYLMFGADGPAMPHQHAQAA